eukprot:COSAG01_NODE_492_length_16335_cov_63.722284_22_plen_91_part_00
MCEHTHATASTTTSWACPLMPLKSEIMLPHYAAPLCCHYADYAAIMPIMPPFNCLQVKKVIKNDSDFFFKCHSHHHQVLQQPTHYHNQFH